MVNQAKFLKILTGRRSFIKKSFLILTCFGLLSTSGCAAIGLVAYSLQSDTVKVLAQYPKLDNHSIAVMIATSYDTMYLYPKAQLAICKAVSKRLEKNLKNVTVVDPETVINFQRSTPYWAAMRYSKLIKQMNVERLVIINVDTYRTHPPHNTNIWKGVVDADVGVVSADAGDPDNFVFNQHLRVIYPQGTTIGIVNTDSESMNKGLVSSFSLKAAGLFYDHEEPRKKE